MKKILLSLSVLMLALTNAQADVAINDKNFPDEKLREAVKDFDYLSDDDGKLSAEEIENFREIQVGGAKNFKGLELLPNLETIILVGDAESYSSITSFDAKPFKKLGRLDFHNYAVTSLDLTYSNSLWNIEINNCRDLSAIKTASNGEPYAVYLINLPKLIDISKCELKNARGIEFKSTGIQDIDVSNNPTLEWLRIAGSNNEDGEMVVYELNSVNIAGCDLLWDLGLVNVKLQSIRINNLARFYDLSLFQCETKDIVVENMPNLGGLECSDCSIQNLTIKKCPVLNGVGCANNNIHNLIIDDSPNLFGLNAENNKLMWLDMSHVQNYEVGETNYFKVDNQTPGVVAVKLSPTETGLLVHERFDVKRVKNLRAKGIGQTPRETTVDGIRYFVFYDNGPDTPNLVGSDCGYEYETKWPYPWVEENSKDNNLPVTLNVYKWTKHQAFLKVSKNRVEGVYGQPAPEAPEITRSQDYDGKITFSSSNENVVKVDPNTGVLTVIGAGTATINVKGAETDYRLAPSTSYTVFIDKATPIISFPQMEINCVYGQEVPLNQLTVEWYEGTVTYSSANTKKATVTAEGVVTTLGAGDVTINGIAPETNNFKRAQVSYVLHIDKAVSPVFAFEKDHIDALLGEPVPENKLSKGLYDGKVLFTSSDENIAAIGTDGEIILKAAGTVTITANGPETENCYQATPASYTLTIEDPDGIRNVNVNDNDNEWYNVNGVRLSGKPSQKGVYIVNGRKVLVK